MRKLLCLFSLVVFALPSFAQESFMQSQLTNANVVEAFANKDSLMRRQFLDKGLKYPPKEIYIRSFKYDSQLEVWVKNNPKDTFQLFKTYRICALSGYLGPKRRRGDYQVPEGFYYINDFNPHSTYHLGLGLNYPNYADRLNGDEDPGGDIFIHGSCVTIGCIPLTNPQIEELYVLAVHARAAGEDFIPVHIFPVRFNNKHSMDYLGKISEKDNDSHRFWVNLRNAYDYFDNTHRLPIVMIDGKGKYILEQEN